MPSRSSFATRMAMSSLVKPASVMLLPLNHSAHIDARAEDERCVEFARLHGLLGLDDRSSSCCGHDFVEVATRLAVDKVAGAVGLVSLDEGVVGGESALEQGFAAVEQVGFFALCADR